MLNQQEIIALKLIFNDENLISKEIICMGAYDFKHLKGQNDSKITAQELFDFVAA